MNPQAPKPAQPVQLAPEALVGFYFSLADNLARSGLAPQQLNEILAGHVSAECVSCGLRLGGEELGLLALSRDNPDPNNQKFTRLSLGYCGRNGCMSRLYDVHFAEHPLVDWSTIIRPAENLSTPRETQPATDLLIPPRSASSKLLLRLFLALLALSALVYVTLTYTEGRIPLFQPKHNYAIDPSSTKTPGK
jgi:hypothetical protein